MSDYAPKPGSVAARAIAHLESLPAGTEMMTSALAEAINVPGGNMAPNLEAPLTHGLLFRRQRDTHPRSPYWWSLTDHGARPKSVWPPKSATPDWPAERNPAPKTTQDAPTVEVARTPAPAPEKPRQQAASPAREAGVGPSRMQVAVWSDGALVIERGTETMALRPDETRVLVRYLERMVEVGA